MLIAKKWNKLFAFIKNLAIIILKVSDSQTTGQRIFLRDSLTRCTMEETINYWKGEKNALPKLSWKWSNDSFICKRQWTTKAIRLLPELLSKIEESSWRCAANGRKWSFWFWKFRRSVSLDVAANATTTRRCRSNSTDSIRWRKWYQ